MIAIVHWNQQARDDYMDIVDYFVDNGWDMAAINFRKNVREKIDSICKFPGSGRPTKEFKNVRYALVDKHRRMYYKYGADSLTLLAFFDARQHPSKSPF
ncbi:MAG TPA: type II toxin-antitoxin system RelE/ParE family toxin [Bacteroidetes bacterium]|nr:type II toxin-antitoxin system RelE/ParE family toxin [Bacteroidota bacterium]